MTTNGFSGGLGNEDGDPAGAEPRTVAAARSAALRYLSYRARTETELRRRLGRDFGPDTVDSVVESMRRAGLVDDADFAAAWTGSRNARKPRSASAVRRELLSKGVSRDVADEAVSGLDDEDSAYRAVRRLARRAGSQPADAFRRRLWGYLQRRGYGSYVTRRTIERVCQEINEEDAGPDWAENAVHQGTSE